MCCVLENIINRVKKKNVGGMNVEDICFIVFNIWCFIEI